MTVVNDNSANRQNWTVDGQINEERLLANTEQVAAIAEAELLPEKCTIEVCSDGILGRPPPDYSLTSPCLPPNSPIEQDWPPEPPPPFDGYPPYPAGPPLLKIAYPKDIPGPTYACPQCSGKFLASFLLFFCFHKANQKDPFYHRPAGVVQCPFCHTAISIGHYVRTRAYSLATFGLLFLLSSLTFALANMIFLDCSRPYFFAVGMMATFALVLVFVGVRMCTRYRETERIEFS